MPRVIIAAAGESSRWRMHRGTTKHLAVVNGEVLLHRTCAQFLRHGSEVVVVGRDETYAVPGTSLYIPPFPPDRRWLDLGKFLSSRHLWATAERTHLIFGDVYYTDEAVTAIMAIDRDWSFILRPNHSTVTGGRPEVFGISFLPSAHAALDHRLDELVRHQIAPNIGGWRLYRDMIRPSYGNDFRNTRHIKIDDMTTDLDYPGDLDKLEKALAAHAV
jgi:hypothetical protein